MGNGIKALLQQHVDSVDLSKEATIDNLLAAGMIALLTKEEGQDKDIKSLKKSRTWFKGALWALTSVGGVILTILLAAIFGA